MVIVQVRLGAIGDSVTASATAGGGGVVGGGIVGSGGSAGCWWCV